MNLDSLFPVSWKLLDLLPILYLIVMTLTLSTKKKFHLNKSDVH